MQGHRLRLGESLAPLRWPLCGRGSTRSRSAQAVWYAKRSLRVSSPLEGSVRHLNRLRAKWNVNRRKGRPRQTAWLRPVASGAAVVQVTPHLSCVGVPLFAHWLDQHESFAPVVARLKQAIQADKHAHPDDDFTLLHHQEQTLLRRFQALFFAPLVGIEKLASIMGSATLG